MLTKCPEQVFMKLLRPTQTFLARTLINIIRVLITRCALVIGHYIG